MTKLKAYKELSASNLQWGRIDSKTIYVWVSGYLTQDCYEIESFLRQAKIYCISMRFDERCGKTMMTLIERKG